MFWQAEAALPKSFKLISKQLCTKYVKAWKMLPAGKAKLCATFYILYVKRKLNPDDLGWEPVAVTWVGQTPRTTFGFALSCLACVWKA
jgi:hypothetical protein